MPRQIVIIAWLCGGFWDRFILLLQASLSEREFLWKKKLFGVLLLLLLFLLFYSISITNYLIKSYDHAKLSNNLKPPTNSDRGAMCFIADFRKNSLTHSFLSENGIMSSVCICITYNVSNSLKNLLIHVMQQPKFPLQPVYKNSQESVKLTV